MPTRTTTRFLLLAAGLLAGCSSELKLVAPDGRSHVYRVHRPAKAQGPLPIVLILHGGGGNAEQAENSLSFDALADQHGFLAVYPQGIGHSKLGTFFATWNSDEECCGDALAQRSDDVGFIRVLIDELGRKHGGDVEHVFAVGISNGGDMAHRLGCELSDRVDGIAAVAAPRVISPCAPPRPVPTLIIHGLQDPCALYDGGAVCGGCFSRALAQAFGSDAADAGDTFSCMGAPDVAAAWRQRNGCQEGAGEVTYSHGGATCRAWREGCPGAEVELCSVEGHGHSYPGVPRACAPKEKVCNAVADATGPVSLDLDAAAEVWRFFAAHR